MFSEFPFSLPPNFSLPSPSSTSPSPSPSLSSPSIDSPFSGNFTQNHTEETLTKYDIEFTQREFESKVSSIRIDFPLSSSSSPFPSVPSHFTPLKHFFLRLVGVSQSAWHRRCVVVTSSALLVFKKDGDFSPQLSLPLQSISSVSLWDASAVSAKKNVPPYGVEILTGDSLKKKSDKSLKFISESREIQIDWVNGVRERIERAKILQREEDAEREKNKKSKENENSANSSSSAHLNIPHGYSYDIPDEWIKRSGLPLRSSAWRKSLNRRGLINAMGGEGKNEKSKFIESTTPQRDSLGNKGFSAVSAICSHNTQNALMMGAGGLKDLKGGALQSIHIDINGQYISPSAPSASSSSSLSSSSSPSLSSSSSNNSSSPWGSCNFSSSPRFGDIKDAIDTTRESNNSKASSSSSSALDIRLDIPSLGDVSDLSWMDDRLLVGSSGGVVVLYKSSDGPSKSPLPVSSFTHPRSTFPPSSFPSPGKWNPSHKVRRVLHHPSVHQNFLSLVNNYYTLWDMEKSKILQCDAASAFPLLCASWNPFSPQEFLVGGVDGALRVIDTRLSSSSSFSSPSSSSSSSKNIAFNLPSAHSDVIRDVHWSPLVSQWFSSASSDGTIKIWDIRYNADPVRILSHHKNDVTCVRWSKSHCEMLISGGADCTMKLWNLRVAPNFLLYSSDPFDSPLRHCEFSPTNPLVFWGADCLGEMKSVAITREGLKDYVPHRTKQNSQNPQNTQNNPPLSTAEKRSNSTVTIGSDLVEGIDGLSISSLSSSSSSLSSKSPPLLTRLPHQENTERLIEESLYLRDFSSAWSLLSSLCQSYYESGNYEWAGSLLKLTGPNLFQQTANDKSQGSKSFTILLNELSRFIPSNTLRLTKMDIQSSHRIQFLKLRIAIIKLQSANKWRDIVSLEREICYQLDKNSIGIDTFDQQNLSDLCHTILPNDHIKGTEFALHIARTLRDCGNFGLFILCAKLLFYPTIYDKMGFAEITAASSGGGGVGGGVGGASKDIEKLTKGKRGKGGDEKGREGGGGDDEESLSDSSEGGGGADGSDPESEGNTKGRAAAAAAAKEKKKTEKKLIPPGTPSVVPSSVVGPPPSASRLGRRPSFSASMSSVVSVPQTPSRMGGHPTAHIDKTAFTIMERDMRNPKIVIPQLELMVNIFTAAQEGNSNNNGGGSGGDSGESSSNLSWNPFSPPSLPIPSSPTPSPTDLFNIPPLTPTQSLQIIRLMEEVKEQKKLFPSLLHLMYFSALTVAKKYDNAFIFGSKLSFSLKNYSFSLVISSFLSEVTFPQFQHFIEFSCNVNPQYPWQNTKLISAILTIVNILFHSEFLPECLTLFIPQQMGKMLKLLEKSFKAMLIHKDYSPNMMGEGGNTAPSSSPPPPPSIDLRLSEVRRRCENILISIGKMKSSMSEEEEPFYAQLVEQLISMGNLYKGMEEKDVKGLMKSSKGEFY